MQHTPIASDPSDEQKNDHILHKEDSIAQFPDELHSAMLNDGIILDEKSEEELNQECIDAMIEADAEIERQKNLILSEVKHIVSKPYYADILALIEESENTFSYSIEDKEVGEPQKDADYPELGFYWVNQTTNGGYTGDTFAGTVSIRIGDNKYFQFHYSM